MTRLIWMGVQAIFVGWLTYGIFREHPAEPVTVIGTFFVALVFCAFLTAILTRMWDAFRYKPMTAVIWTLSVFALSGAVTAAVHFLGDDRGEWPLVFIMVAVAAALASIIVVPLLDGLLPKISQPSSEGGRLGGPGSRGAQRLEQGHGLGIGEDPR